MTLSAPLLALLRAQAPTIQRFCTLTLPADAGGLMRVSDQGTLDADGNWYEPRVPPGGWGDLFPQLSGRGGDLQALTTTVQFRDIEDRTISPTAIPQSTGPLGRGIKLAQCYRAPAQIVIGGVGLASSDYYTAFTGVVEKWTRADHATFTLSFRTDDAALTKPVPHRKFSPIEWPLAFRPPKESAAGGGSVFDQYEPLVMGRCDSTGLGNSGLRRTYYADTVRGWYIVSLGAIGATGFRVFKNNVEDVTAAWTRINPGVAGRTWTAVEWPGLTPEDVITVDCQGIDLGSYGTYTNPANQLRFVLENMVWRDWNGTAASIAAPTHTDTTSFTALASDLGSYESAPIIGGNEVTGQELLRQFLEGKGVQAWWTEAGKIGVVMWKTLASGSPYVSDPYIMQATDVLGPLQLLEPTLVAPLDGLAVSYLSGPDGTAQANLSVFHPRRITSQPQSLDNRWGPGRAA